MANNQLDHLYLAGVKATGKQIGFGAYGKVFEVEFCGTLYAAKAIHSVLVEGVEREGFESMKAKFIAECLQTSSLGHQNVVQMLGVYEADDQSLLPILVMEKMQDSLASLVKRQPNIPMHTKLSILLDVSRGLWYLHSHQSSIIHRDLSPNNILLTAHCVAKISDLGVAKVIRADKKKTKAPGTADFMAPEALQDPPDYGLPLDVFSYGGVILHVVNQEWPEPRHFVKLNPDGETSSALSEVERRQQYIDKMAETPEDLQALVKECLKDNPISRPLIADVSERIKKMKEAEGTRCPNADNNLMTSRKVTTSRESQTTTATATTSRETQTTITTSGETQTTTTSRETQTTTTASRESQATAPQVSSQVGLFNKAFKIQWQKVASLPECGSGHNAVLFNGLIYVGGGTKEKGGRKVGSYSVHVYNPHDNEWCPSINTPCCDFAMTVLNDQLVIAGGATTNDVVLNDISVLDPQTNQWKPYNKMPNARYNAVAIGYHSMLIIIGGVMPTKGWFKKLSDGYWNVQSTTELLDTTSGCWHTCGNIPSPHTQLKAAIINDTLYVLGGADSKLKPSQKVFGASLDNITTHVLNWQCLTDVPFCYSTPVVVHGKYLLTVGGTGQSDNSLISEVHALNPLNALWKQITDLPVTTCLAAPVCMDNRLIIIGGMDKDKKFSHAVWTGVIE